MINKTKMIHVRIPTQLLNALDEFLRKSKTKETRSGFIIKSIEEQIKKEKFKWFINTYAGSLKEEEVPHWKDEESVDAWVSNIRKASEEVFKDKWNK
ncbi:MAG: hypothetical protein PWQ97_870 [Tepidanaerobacteraceae bacterium]|nr:hypothetical protein [Tepidanaerobacteraceae bacterium]